MQTLSALCWSHLLIFLMCSLYLWNNFLRSKLTPRVQYTSGIHNCICEEHYHQATGGAGGKSPCPYSQQRPVRTNLSCSPPSLVRLGWVLSTHTPSGGTWVMHTRGIGLVYMTLLARHPLLAQNLARICASLLGRARCPRSPILSFPSRFPSSGD